MDFIQQYIANAQIQLMSGGLTKVSRDWGGMNLIEDVNRLYFILGGEGWIKIEDREYTPAPGQLFLLPASTRISFRPISDNTLFKYWCHFTATVGDVNLFKIVKPPDMLNIAQPARLKRQFKSLLALYRSDSLASPLQWKSILYEMISMFVERAVAVRASDAASPPLGKINTVLDYIDRNLTGQIRIETLAKLVHLHPNYFMQYFKSVLGMPPIVYINKKRVQRAQQLIMETDCTVSDIAEQVGMDLHYLSRVFKSYTGCSPTQYRKLNADPFPAAYHAAFPRDARSESVRDKV